MRKEPLYAACACVLLAIYAAHVGLSQLGHWQDEFILFAHYRAPTAGTFVHRLVAWSPRPFSEALIYLYFLLTERAGRPLFAEVVGFTWAVFAAPACVYVFHARTTREHRALRCYVAASVPVLCVLSSPLNEMFLWPVAALAYVPAIAGITALLFVLASNHALTRRQWIALGCCGVVSSLSVEFASVVCGLFFSLLLLSVLLWPGRMGGPVAIAACSAPILSALLVCAMLTTHRTAHGSPLTADLHYVHHGWRSFTAAVPIFFRSLVGSYASGYQTSAPLRNTASAACFFGGMLALAHVCAVPPPARIPTGRAFAALAVACFLGSFASVFAGLYQFGVMCCERHDSFRDCLQVIGLASLALWLARGPLREVCAPRRLREAARSVGVVLIAAACLLMLPARLGELAAVNGHFHRLRAATKETWRSGENGASKSMIYVVPPLGLLVGGWMGQDGVYRHGGGSWHADAILDYFHKEQMCFVHLAPWSGSTLTQPSPSRRGPR